MKINWKIGAGIGAVIVAAGIVYVVSQSRPQPRADAALCYRDQSGTELEVKTGMALRLVGCGAGAHGLAIIGRDGIKYCIADQCPSSGPERSYTRPQNSAGPEAQELWDFMWKSPNAANNRCYAWNVGTRYQGLPPPHATCEPTYFCKTFVASAGTFAPRLYPCQGAPTPRPTTPPAVTVPPGPCPTCAPVQPCVTQPPGVTAPPVKTPTVKPPPLPTRYATP